MSAPTTPDRPADPAAGGPGPIHPLLAGRRSVSVFDPGHELSDDELGLLLEAARWAPSSGNTQPWSFVLCRRGDEQHRRLLPLLAKGNTAWVPAASVVLVGLAKIAAAPDDTKTWYGGFGEYDLGQSVAHLSVQAESMGLRVHQFSGYDREAFAAQLDVPAWYRPMAGVAVGRWWPPAEREGVDEGTAAREERPRTRRPAADLIRRG